MDASISAVERKYTIYMAENSSTTYHSPWTWVPTLYFAEGIPYFIVTVLSIVLFKDLGMSNTDIGVFTSLITFPWIFKPIWSPFVDIIRYKRWWIVAMEGAMAILVGLLACTAPQGYFALAFVLFFVTAFASATHDIAADGFYMIALNDTQQANFVGIRSTFYKIAQIFCQSFVLIFLFWLKSPKLPERWQDVEWLQQVIIFIEERNSIDMVWRWSLMLCAIILALITLWHLLHLQSSNDTPRSNNGQTWQQIGRTFATFFAKPQIVWAIAFMLLYRLPEALLLKMELPFLKDGFEAGGLSLSDGRIGTINFVSTALMLLGGIMGGLIAGKWGLKKVMLIMCLFLTLPCVVYCYLAMAQPQDFWSIAACIGFEQMSYGIGYTACMLYMIHIAEGEYKTSHFSICTAFMFLGLMLPGMLAGWIADSVGYTAFFWIVMACCVPSIFITLIIQKQL